MHYFDVFNGDADGLCGLHQLRLVEPREATLITGVKRDIALLQQVPLVPGAVVTVLDVSLDRNRGALTALLDAGAQVDYFDHHRAGDIPRHAALRAHIDTAADVCTSVLVDRHLDGAQRIWAVVGAFGDNMDEAARSLAATLDLQESQIAALQELGQCLNYNAYGDCAQDLFIAPAELYRQVRRHNDPFRFMALAPAFSDIRQGCQDDLAQALQREPYITCDGGQLFLLPDAPWSRRVNGTYGNALARRAPDQAHAVLTAGSHGTFMVSVRAPLRDPHGADRLCRAFAGGGGREAAAGIDSLEPQQLAQFVSAFERIFGPAALKKIPVGSRLAT